jgi:hypothetical protein
MYGKQCLRCGRVADNCKWIKKKDAPTNPPDWDEELHDRWVNGCLESRKKNPPRRPRHFGIPTKYKGITFRSRTEARWARFFDKIRWPWEYEPIDLRGYLPDFVLPFDRGPLLIEIKSDLLIKDLHKHAAKIEASGWEHEAIILGGTLLPADRDGKSFAKFERSECAESIPIGIMTEGINWPEETYWSGAMFGFCLACRSYTFSHEYGDYSCRRCGDNTSVPVLMIDSMLELAGDYWVEAGEEVRWRG